MNFNSHYRMNTTDIIDYTFEHINFFNKKENLVCKEIGDGNINYVYRILDSKENKSIVVKQADTQTRVRPDGYLNPNRSTREAEVLKKQFKLAPEFIPQVFYSDDVMATIIMEDIGDYTSLKSELMRFSIFKNLGKLLAEFIIKTTLPLTSLVIGYEKKSQNEFKFFNPELCRITEQLVFTHPYTDEQKRNILFEENADWLKEKFYTNQKLIEVAAKLKNKFCNYPQSLIHGDLHSGSVFVKQEFVCKKITKIKIIDPEFAFYGPIGYDLGNILAHLIFAENYAYFASKEKSAITTNFISWIKNEQKLLLENFARTGFEYLKKNINGSTYRCEKFIIKYIEQIIIDAILFCGAELNRRVIGSAKTAEIINFNEANQRIAIERQIVNLGIEMMLYPERSAIKNFNCNTWNNKFFEGNIK